MFRDFKNYEIFEDGRVYSYTSKRFLKPSNNSTGGYYKLWLYDNNGNKKNYRLHRVVYESIRGEIPEGLQVNHIDEDKSNNSISNLNLMTCKENINYGTGRQRQAEKRSKQVAAYQNGVLVMTFPSTAEAGRQGFSSGHISQCCNGKLKSYRGYQWLYFEDSPPLFYIAA